MPDIGNVLLKVARNVTHLDNKQQEQLLEWFFMHARNITSNQYEDLKKNPVIRHKMDEIDSLLKELDACDLRHDHEQRKNVLQKFNANSRFIPDPGEILADLGCFTDVFDHGQLQNFIFWVCDNEEKMTESQRNFLMSHPLLKTPDNANVIVLNELPPELLNSNASH